MEQTCPFCQIIAGERPGRIVYRDDLVTAFWDRAPITPIHILIVPNQHIASLNEANHEHQNSPRPPVADRPTHCPRPGHL